MTLWVKPARKAQLKTLSSMLGVPAWRVIDQALEQLIRTLPAEERRALDTLAKRAEKAKAGRT